jgi:hypothetical protein
VAHPVDQPTVTPHESTYHILDYAAVCLPGFDQSTPVDVVIVGPDGQAIARPYPGGEPDPVVAQVSLLLDLDLPTGRYEVTAGQSGMSSQGSFMVEEPPQPHILVATPMAVARGDGHDLGGGSSSWGTGHPRRLRRDCRARLCLSMIGAEDSWDLARTELTPVTEAYEAGDQHVSENGGRGVVQPRPTRDPDGSRGQRRPRAGRG